ncbi:hypothetical protein ACJIZ3_016048 [Penstemon smallii]|uniref:GIY-YIG domain-containing protein n=1 Tax=Penstemon smallii TaxID=265156 RepID=A0ABD3RPC3_9LAMI
MLLSKTFRSSKPHSNYCPNLVPISPKAVKSPQSPSKIELNKPSSSSIKSPISTSSSKNSWTVYLIISSNPPIKTYVGVTNNFSRRYILFSILPHTQTRWYMCSIFIWLKPFLVLKETLNSYGFFQSNRKKKLEGTPLSDMKRLFIYLCCYLLVLFLLCGCACVCVAYEFESKWKIISRKLPRKRNKDNEVQEDNSQQQQLLLLQHRYAALNKVEESIDCCHLKIDWHLAAEKM